jgi:hypothetical protein
MIGTMGPTLRKILILIEFCPFSLSIDVAKFRARARNGYLVQFVGLQMVVVDVLEGVF